MLVIKAAPVGREQCVCGGKQAAAPKGCCRGGLSLQSGSNVYLRKNGAIELSGRVPSGGHWWSTGGPYKPCSCGEGGFCNADAGER